MLNYVNTEVERNAEANQPNVSVQPEGSDPEGWKALAYRIAGTASSVIASIGISYAIASAAVGGTFLSVTAGLITGCAVGAAASYIAYEFFYAAEFADPHINPASYLGCAVSYFSPA